MSTTGKGAFLPNEILWCIRNKGKSKRKINIKIQNKTIEKVSPGRYNYFLFVMGDIKILGGLEIGMYS